MPWTSSIFGQLPEIRGDHGVVVAHLLGRSLGEVLAEVQHVHVIADVHHQAHVVLDKTIVLIEHDMSLVMDVSDYVYVLDFGKNLAEGTPEQVRDDDAVIAAYLGELTKDA